GWAEAEIRIDNRLLHRLDHRLVPDLHRKQPRFRHADGRELVERHMAAIGVDLHGLQHRSRGPTGAQSAELVLEGLRGALHSALQFVDVETRCGHCTSPLLKNWHRCRWPACGAAAPTPQPATMVPRPVPRRIAPIEPGSAIENTMIGSDVSRASAKAVASMTL